MWLDPIPPDCGAAPAGLGHFRRKQRRIDDQGPYPQFQLTGAATVRKDVQERQLAFQKPENNDEQKVEGRKK